MDSPGHTVWLKSEKFEMELGRLSPASEVAEGHTLPFFLKIFFEDFFLGCFTRQCGLFRKATKIPNAGHHILILGLG
jgi:hypothetical protein